MKTTILNRTLRIIQLHVLLLLMQFTLHAQVYPVQVVPQLLPPYTLNFSDYYQGTQEKLVVLLTNTDLTKPALQVRLKMSIQGQSAKFRSREGVYYPPITLDGGAPQRITLADLASYFNLDNLEVEGVPRSQFQQNQKLPEGFYQFCFEAYEYNTNRLVGRSNCAMAWISLQEPPLLNLPVKGESIAYKDPTNIIFQWTPRNMGSPTSAFNTEYEFTLVELWDNGIAPEAAFGTMQPLYRTTTQATTLLYGPGEPLLIPGKRYGWRIRAQASDGSQKTDAYRNNGYSEIFWFTYQRDCPMPFNIQSEVSSGRVTITWNAALQQTRFTVDYRERGQTNNQWYTVNSSTNRAMLYDLKKDKQYEYRVGAFCDAGNNAFPASGAVYSDIKNFYLDGSSADEEGAGCNILQPDLQIANREPIQNLLSGEVISAGDFPVKLITVQGQGNFSGTGYITIPFVGKVAVKVRFSGITVNTDKQLIGGIIETTYDAKESQLVDAGEVYNNGKIFNELDSIITTLVSKLQENDKEELLQIVDSLGSALTTHINNGEYTSNVKQAVTDKMNELKDIVGKTPLNTSENKDSVVSKMTAINQLLASNGTATAAPPRTKKSYYLVEGNKFYHGDTIFLPQSNKAYTIKAYRDSSGLFNKGSIWSGISRNLDSATSTYIPAVVSGSISGSTISTLYSDSLRKDTLICKVVVVNIVFKEDAAQNWGFDGNDPATENDYPSYKTTTPVPGIKWKSINTDGSSEKVTAEVSPAGAERKVYFTLTDSINFGVTPRIPVTAVQQLNITSTKASEIALIPKVGYFTNDTIQLKIAGKTKKVNQARLVIVHESNDDVQVVANGTATAADTTVVISQGKNKFLDSRRGIDILGDDQVIYRAWARDSVVIAGVNKICESNAYNTDVVTTAVSTTQLRDSLNMYYRQGVYEWSVDAVVIVKTLNFDLNRDGKIDVNTWTNPETQVIYDSCIVDKLKVNFIAIDNPSDGSNGMSLFPASNPNKVCFLHPGTAPNVYITATHEIGHGIFSLQHPFDEFKPSFPRGGKDKVNIMNYGAVRNRFRKYQWDKIK